MNKTYLSPSEIHYLMKRFPQIELSYEIIPHKKVSNKYNICLSIPTGTKCFLWITFHVEDAVCFIMELNKDRKISNVYHIPYKMLNLRDSLVIGTIFYGTLIEETRAFVIEDVFECKGIPMKHMYFSEKLGFIEKVFSQIPVDFGISVHLPTIWSTQKEYEYECLYDIPQKYIDKYPVHHIQYRCLKNIAPYLNVFPMKKGFTNTTASNAMPMTIQLPYRANFTKPQYQLKTTFKVMADLQFDIYHLYAFGRNSNSVYYNIAYIPDYTTSVFMNSIFRNIKENKNLDTIEESDDEDDFENMDCDKYVDLKKHVYMECKFHTKFKKWVPLQIVNPHKKVVHISFL